MLKSKTKPSYVLASLLLAQQNKTELRAKMVSRPWAWKDGLYLQGYSYELRSQQGVSLHHYQVNRGRIISLQWLEKDKRGNRCRLQAPNII